MLLVSDTGGVGCHLNHSSSDCSLGSSSCSPHLRWPFVRHVCWWVRVGCVVPVVLCTAAMSLQQLVYTQASCTMAGILYSEVWFWPYPVPAMLCPREWGLMHQGAAAAIAAGECSACTCCTFLLERRVMMMMMTASPWPADTRAPIQHCSHTEVAQYMDFCIPHNSMPIAEGGNKH